MAPAADEDETKSSYGVIRRMTPEGLQQICKERQMWMQPHLNTQLFLNYKGFDAIECLEDYCSVRSLHLGNNNILKIEGLDRMSDLRSLHLEGNGISRIENLSGNLELRQLNLEGNAIKCIEGLSQLKKLEHLTLARNALSSLEDISELQSLPSLTNIDVSQNEIDASDGVIEFWTELTAVKVLRYHQNPGVRHIEHYRKRIVNAMPNLTYLDERPVFPVERKSSAAWAAGGLEAMHQAKRDFHSEIIKQSSVEEDRKELITRNRKLAIARIERQEREAAEKENEAEQRRMQASSSKSPESGDPEALANYEKSWQTKVSLHGVDEVRAQINKQAGMPANAPSKHVPMQNVARQPLAFQPPARGIGSREELGPGPDELSARDVSRQGPPKGVADFAQRSCFRHDAADNAVEKSLEDRQAAVLGDDVWAGPCSTAWRTDPQVPATANRDRRLGQSGQGEQHVMPQLWEQMLPANQEAELKALEMNCRAASGTETSPSMHCLD